jgi:hypothetical protein
VKPNTPRTNDGSKIFAKLQGLSIVGNSVSVDPAFGGGMVSGGIGIGGASKRGTVTEAQVKQAVQAVTDERLATANTEIKNLRRKTDRLEKTFSTTTPSLIGPAGRDGKDGKDGKNGKDGVDGKNGKDGEDGEQGPPGIPDAVLKTITICTAAGAQEIEVYVPKEE